MDRYWLANGLHTGVHDCYGYLKFSHRHFYGCHHELINRYEVSVLHITQNMFVLLLFISVPCNLVYWTYCTNLDGGATCRAGTVCTFTVPEFIPGYFFFFFSSSRFYLFALCLSFNIDLRFIWSCLGSWYLLHFSVSMLTKQMIYILSKIVYHAQKPWLHHMHFDILPKTTYILQMSISFSYLGK